MVARWVGDVERPQVPPGAAIQLLQRFFSDGARRDSVKAQLGPECGMGKKLCPAARHEAASGALDERKEGEDM